MAKSRTNPPNAGTGFSERALNFLVSNAGVRTASSIAGTLGRTTKAVRRKAEKLGISLAVR
jgi:hypothetical protein